MPFENSNQKNVLDVSWNAIFKISVGVIAIYFLFRIREVILWLLFALIIATLFNFLIDFLQRKRVPRLFGVTIVYLGVFGALSYFVYLIAPTLISELEALSVNLPKYLLKLSPLFERLGITAFQNMHTLTATFNASLSKASENVLTAFTTVLGGASAAFSIFSFAFFISFEERLVERTIEFFLPRKYRLYFSQLWPRCQAKVSEWFITRLAGSLFVGLMTYILLFALHSKYALTFSLLSGALDFIPIVGPTIAGIIMVLITAATSIYQAIFILVGFILIQQLENNVLFPILFKRFMGIPPIIILVALVLGGKLWGVMGAILAIPLAGIIYEFSKDYFRKLRETLETKEGQLSPQEEQPPGQRIENEEPPKSQEGKMF